MQGFASTLWSVQSSSLCCVFNDLTPNLFGLARVTVLSCVPTQTHFGNTVCVRVEHTTYHIHMELQVMLLAHRHQWLQAAHTRLGKAVNISLPFSYAFQCLLLNLKAASNIPFNLKATLVPIHLSIVQLV